MDRFAQLLALYSENHSHPLNKILHLIGVPFVLFSTLIFFSWIHISMPGFFDFQTTWVYLAVLLIYFARLDRQYTLALAAMLLPAIFLVNFLSAYWVSFPLFCVLFAVGWILQLVGYFIEGEHPTFIKSPDIIPVLPLLVLADWMRERRWRQDLEL